jgi:chromosome segregation and condensation protein ScpB
VARAKRNHGRLSIFKGKEAKLNYAVFQVLALKGPLTIYDIRREVKKRRLLHRKLYSVVNRRVRTLKQQGYIEEVGTRKTLTGTRAVLYQITPKAYLAMLLNQININWLIEKASETDTLDLSAILAKYLKD